MNKNTETHIDHTRAILDIGKALNKVDLLEAELKALKGEIVSNPDLKKYLADPSMTRLDKIKTADIAGDIEEVNNVFMESVNYLKKQEYVEVVPTIAEVNELDCVGCNLCVEVCPYGAPSLVMKRGKLVSEINEALCKGCGLCVAGCRGKAINLRGFNDMQLLTQLKTLLQFSMT